METFDPKTLVANTIAEVRKIIGVARSSYTSKHLVRR